MSLYTIWQSGVGVLIQDPENTKKIGRCNWGIRVQQETGTNWFHFNIPTLTEINKSPAFPMRFNVRGKLVGAANLGEFMFTKSIILDTIAGKADFYYNQGERVEGKQGQDTALSLQKNLPPPPANMPPGDPAGVCVSLLFEFNAPDAAVELYGAGVQFLQHNKTPRVLATGKTSPGDWRDTQPHPKLKWVSPGGIWVDVNTSAAKLDQLLPKKEVPIYQVSLKGDVNHWTIIGTDAVYGATSKGFTVFIRDAIESRTPQITPGNALKNNWYLEWTALGLD